jgi:hypothetical protein
VDNFLEFIETATCGSGGLRGDICLFEFKIQFGSIHILGNKKGDAEKAIDRFIIEHMY